MWLDFLQGVDVPLNQGSLLGVNIGRVKIVWGLYWGPLVETTMVLCMVKTLTLMMTVDLSLQALGLTLSVSCRNPSTC